MARSIITVYFVNEMFMASASHTRASLASHIMYTGYLNVHMDMDTHAITCNHTRHASATNLVTGRAVHDDGRSDGQGRDGKHGDDHPVRPSKLGIHADDGAGLLIDVLEDLQDSLGTQVDLSLLRVFVQLLPLGCQLQSDSPNDRLEATTPTWPL